jgi:hypothetical protein
MMSSKVESAEKSFGQLSGIGDVTGYMWPSYRRITAAQGGDISAEFQFSGPDALLEQWFYGHLGREFSEHYQGQTAFLGRIHTMRLAYKRLVLTISLDWLFNSVACAYTKLADKRAGGHRLCRGFGQHRPVGPPAAHHPAIDNTTGFSEAEQMAAEFLADFKEPRVSRGEIQRKLDEGSFR